MGIFGALTTAITGLRAQSYALENISNNIANSQTIGYRRTETSFVDLVPDSAPNRQALGSVAAFSRPTNSVQGDVQNSEVDTFIAINGDGFFVVGDSAGTTDGRPLFTNENFYTRRGDFELDRNGYLVNGGGYYLRGFEVDSNTGNVVGSSPETIQVSNDFLPAKATNRINYRANLAATPRTQAYDSEVPGSEYLDPALVSGDFIEADNATDFIEQSIAGGAITTYDPTGHGVNIQFRWAKTEGTGGADDTWNMFYLENSNASGTDPAWRSTGIDYTFDALGQLLTPTSTSVTIAAPIVDNVQLDDVNLIHDVGGITQFEDTSGAAKITDLQQNGYGAGELSGVGVSEQGRIVAYYTNGQALDIAEISVVSFNSGSGLKKLDGGAFQQTQESGDPILRAQGTVIGQAIESSNTDIADEFSKLIVTQQAYAANTRVITTGDEMIQEVLNLIR